MPTEPTSGRKRPNRTTLFALGFAVGVGALIYLLGPFGGSDGPSTRFDGAVQELSLLGDSESIGTETGSLLRDELLDESGTSYRPDLATLIEATLEGAFGEPIASIRDTYLDPVNEAFRCVPQRYREEMASFAQAARARPLDILIYNMLPDLLRLDRSIAALVDSSRVSGAEEGTTLLLGLQGAASEVWPQGPPLIRRIQWDMTESENPEPLLLHDVALLTYPGVIGTRVGTNRHGVTLIVNQSDTVVPAAAINPHDSPRPGLDYREPDCRNVPIPITLMARELLEMSATMDEVVRYLSVQPAPDRYNFTIIAPSADGSLQSMIAHVNNGPATFVEGLRDGVRVITNRFETIDPSGLDEDAPDQRWASLMAMFRQSGLASISNVGLSLYRANSDARNTALWQLHPAEGLAIFVTEENKRTRYPLLD